MKTANRTHRKIVIVNQAVNYLTIGYANAFYSQFDEVVLMTGSVHAQGEELNSEIKINWINQYMARPSWKKALSYARACVSIWFKLIFKYRNHEVFFVSVPPMAYLLNLLVPNRFSMLIWDVFPDAFMITGMKKSHVLYRVWSYLNRLSFKKAHRFFTIGDKMAELLETYVERNKIIIQPIWSIFQEKIDLERNENPFLKEHHLNDKFIVQYSGNIGLAHKVEKVVELAKILKNEKDILFQIIGRGPRVPALQKMVEEEQLPNCMFLPFQSDEMFPYSLSAADIGVVILDEITSKGSVPSKSYNLISQGIPSLYISSTDSELYDYVKKYNHGECYQENELEKASKYILKLKNNKEVYNELSQNALKAAEYFKRSNADELVAKYMKG